MRIFGGLRHSVPVEYFMLHDVTPVGRSIGVYANKRISEVIIDPLGQRYVYAGIVPRQWDGKFDLDALKAGEFIVQPGLIYRREQIKRSWLESIRPIH